MILLDQKHPTMSPLGVASGVTQVTNIMNRKPPQVGLFPN